MLDRTSPLPLYFQLRTLLLQQIESGALKPGDTMPTERELIDRFGVSRITVRQAVNSLMSDGLLYRQRGLGTFVRSNRIEQELSTLTGFSEEMLARGLTPGAKLISAEMAAPDACVASRLQLSAGQNVFRMVRVRLADGEPMAFDVNYLPPDLGERLMQENLQEALYTLFDRYGVEIDWADQAIQSTPADEFVASHLGIKKGTPVLQMERVVYTVDGRPVELSRTSYRADRYTYRVRLKRNRNQRGGLASR
ncbi:MAG: GntR family transcriptional regulator [Chloroflexota bacterium]